MAMRNTQSTNEFPSWLAELAERFPEIDLLTYEEAMKMLDIRANDRFGISAQEFILRWNARDFSIDDMEAAEILSWDIPHREQI